MDHPDKSRVMRLVDELFAKLDEEFEGRTGLDPIRDVGIDEAMLIFMAAVRDPETQAVHETPVIYCTSTRRFVQLGIIDTAREKMVQDTFYEDDEDEDDDDE